MFQKAASRSEISEGKIWGGRVGAEYVAIYLVNGELFATNDFCTHEDCLLSEDGLVEGEEVECLCHGSRFIIRSGEAMNPPAFEPIPVYAAEQRGDDVYVDLP
jgi:3-phenylpropionate/trans-cinnamate dioxygenase ferredoxin subunit